MLIEIEILASLLDYLAVPDLIRFARVSKRMREMVYDDTRWVQRLKLMECWDEREARRRAETSLGDASTVVTAHEAKRTGLGVHGTPGAKSINAAGPTAEPARKRGISHGGYAGDGFDTVALSPSGSGGVPVSRLLEPAARLAIFSRVRSVRGGSRNEYGKVHGALSSFYMDAAGSKNPTDAIVFRTYR